MDLTRAVVKVEQVDCSSVVGGAIRLGSWQASPRATPPHANGWSVKGRTSPPSRLADRDRIGYSPGCSVCLDRLPPDISHSRVLKETPAFVLFSFWASHESLRRLPAYRADPPRRARRRL